MRRVLTNRGALLTLLALPVGAVAQVVPPKGPPEPLSPTSDRFYIRASYLRGAVTTFLREDPSLTQPGTVVNGEDDLGFDPNVDLGRVELGFRFGDDQRLRVDYLKLNRNGDRRLTRQIVFDDTIYNVNDRVESLADVRILGLTYLWDVLHRERYEVGLGFGLHLIAAEGEGEVAARNIRERGSTGFVLPTLAIDGAWRISRRWSATARAQLLTIEADDDKAEFSDYHFDVQYRWRRNIALGLGYSMVGARATSRDLDNPGRFKLETKGPELFFRVSF